MNPVIRSCHVEQLLCTFALYGESVKVYCKYAKWYFISGKQTRNRKVESSSITLSACPHLEESRDCFVGSCFSWKLAHKDTCFVTKGRTCGKGTRKLFFNCVDHLGVGKKNSTSIFLQFISLLAFKFSPHFIILL